jgi:Cu/Ag efflux protein CusF
MKQSIFITRNFLCLLLIAAALTIACNKSPAQSTAKRYHLKGKVVSVDTRGKMVNVDSEAIPDFMPAMTMPYEVKPESDLQKLSPGDEITADVVVQDDKGWLEKIVVTRHAGAAPK